MYGPYVGTKQTVSKEPRQGQQQCSTESESQVRGDTGPWGLSIRPSDPRDIGEIVADAKQGTGGGDMLI